MGVGVDVGATLAKIAVRCAEGGVAFHLEPADALDAVVCRVEAAGAGRVGLTGGGAHTLAGRLDRDAAHVNEFAAWGAGAAALLRKIGPPVRERHLLVSLGTGTSVLLADGIAVSRIGGTALGGGTLVGLGSALLGTSDFAELTELASRGSRSRVDLRVADIYSAGGISLAGDLTAANFGKLARLDGQGAASPSRADLADALMGLVGENVALICSGLAASAQVSRVVFAGSTLRGNPALVDVLRQITSALGREPTFLQDGEFAGALGALLLSAGEGG